MNTNSRLIVTPTNSSEESKPRFWGLEEDNFWWLIGGLVTTMTLLFMLSSVLRLPLKVAAIVSLIPTVLALGFVFGLKQSRPKGYPEDLLSYLLHGPSFGPSSSDKQPEHPTRNE